MNDPVKISIQMRDSGEIVREDVVEYDDIDGHLMYLNYFWGMDGEASVDRKNMWVDFRMSNRHGRADVFFLPA